MQNFPKQRLSFQDKIANDFKWAKETVDAILMWSPPSSPGTPNTEYQQKLSNYKLFNNIIDQNDLARECNPLGLDVGQLKDIVQPYNKTYNKIQVLLGDELSRPFNYKAILVDAAGVRSKIETKHAMLKNYVFSQLQQTLSTIKSSFVPQLVEDMSQEILPPSEVDKYIKYSYKDKREILSEKLLQYLYRYLSVKDKKSDAFKHALLSGDEIVYVGVNGNDPVLEVINPLGFFYHKSGETKWIQDSLYAGYRTYMTVNEVLDNYQEFLTPDQIKKLEENGGLSASASSTLGPTMQYGHEQESKILASVLGVDEGSYSPPKELNILVQHVEWRSFMKVGYLTFINQYGDEEVSYVSETFSIPEGATTYTEEKELGKTRKCKVWEENGVQYKLHWVYLEQIWTATKIGNDIYCAIGPKKEQFRSKDNPTKVHLGYHGVVYSAMNADSVSLMSRMKPFQYLYLIVVHKLKKAIAQEQGKVFHFDISMVDPNLGLEKTLYYLKELNIDFYNPLMNADAPGRDQRGKVSHTSDMSNMSNIINYISLLNAIDQQISEVAGVAKGREGQLAPNEAVTNAQTNLQMSALVTEIYFQLHFKLWEKILTSLVEVAKSAWREKDVVKQYVLDDLSTATLEFTKDDPQDYEIGIFITNSGKEHEMFQALRGIADGLLNTNRASFSDLITLYEATSAQELKQAIKASEDKHFQQQSAAQQQQIESDAAMQKEQQAFELEKQARQHEHEILKASIESFKFQKDQDINNNSVPDQLEIDKLLLDAKFKKRKLDIEEEKLELERERLNSTPKN